MKQLWRNLELEWKILILAALLFVALAWPIQQFFVHRLKSTLSQSIDPQLQDVLRVRMTETPDAQREALAARLERARQWQALLPDIIDEQRRAVFLFSLALFILLILVALWTLRRLTRPLRNLADAVRRIGKGDPTTVVCDSGGALGTLQKAVANLHSELAILRQQAQVQGMEKAWQDIARVMAHEIKNPLTPIRLTLDRIEEKVAAGEEVDTVSLRKYLVRINTQVDMLERLVDQFRSFSREPEARLARVALGDAAAAVADTLTSRMTTEIRGDAVVKADPHLVNQVLLNLWKNALEAGAHSIAADISSRGGQVILSVRDNGSGIDPEALERVWLPYVSFKKGGTGLGLPVVKKLMETMGGSVSLTSSTSAPHQGTTVILTFTAADSNDGGAHAAAGPHSDRR